MKHIFLKLTLLCALFCGATLETWSMEAIVKREKEESFGFKGIKNGGTLRLQMEFGGVTIVVWDKDEILLKSKTIAEASNAELAEKVLKRHEFIHRKENDVYHISRQRVGKEENLNNVNYTSYCTLYIPKDKLSLQLNNKFGSIHMQDSYKCDRADISVQHGSLHINELQTNEMGKLNVQFGTLNVVKANSLQIETAHCGNVKIGTLKTLTHKAQHCGDIHIGETSTLHLDAEFCEVEMDTFNQGSIRMKFTTLHVQSAREVLALTECNHSTFVCTALAKGLTAEPNFSAITATLSDPNAFREFRINGEHNSLKLYIPKGLNAEFFMQRSYGECALYDCGCKWNEIPPNHENDFVHTVTARFGTGKGGEINIHTRHSNTYFMPAKR